MTRKPKIGILTNMTEALFISGVKKRWYLLFKGILWSHDLLVKTNILCSSLAKVKGLLSYTLLFVFYPIPSCSLESFVAHLFF